MTAAGGARVGLRTAAVDELLLDGIAGRFGDRPVQVCTDGALSAELLLERSAAVRDALRAVGAGRGTVVAVKGRRDSWLLPTLLGVLRTGAAYAVIPFNSPAAVEDRLLSVLDPAALVTWSVDPPAAAEGRSRRAVAGADGTLHVTELDGAPAADGPRHPLDPAYVCATSGTTGLPKCVAVPHRAVAAFLGAARGTVDPGPGDVVAARASAAFDLSVWELFASVLGGATAVLIPEDVAAESARLHRRLAETGATVLSTTPSAAYQLAAHDELAGGGLRLRHLLVGGEAADGRRLADVLEAPSFRECRLDDWYGPTEATVSCTAARLVREELTGPEVSIGPPLAGVRAAVAAHGELLIGGAQLALGYLGAARATAAAFVPDPDVPGERLYRTGDEVTGDADDGFTYRGRLDGQVQLRGYRLELGEVERALSAHERVRWSHAAVGGTDRDVLIGYFATHGDAPLDRPATWAQLYRALPRHAVPAALVQVETVPVSEGEKLDPRRLPTPSADDFVTGETDSARPGTETEARMHALWQRLLDVDGIGVDHHFFALGGHSLLAARLLNGITREFGVRLALREVMDRLTIRELSAWVDGSRGGPADHAGAASNGTSKGHS